MQQELADRFDALRRAGAESSALVDAMVEGVLASDERGRIVTANPAARRLLGYDETGDMPNLASLFRVKAAREVVEATLRGEAVQDRELDLGGRSLLVNSRPSPAGGAVLVLHDVTELRRLETVRRDFVANVSHELKTPLTSISGYAETLLSENPDEGDPPDFPAHDPHQRATNPIAGGRPARSFPHRIGSLAAAGGQLDMPTVARDAWQPRADRATAGRVTFKVEIAPDAQALDADAEAMRQILGNLYDNALRFTPPGGSITFASRAVDGGVAVSVRDTGIRHRVGAPAPHLRALLPRGCGARA